MRIIGIDPGLHGGIAGLDTETKTLWAIEMPIVKNQKTEKLDYDIPRICALLRAFQADKVCLEAVHSMPGQGVSSTFLFGKGFGILLGIIGALGNALTLVTPRIWKFKYLLSADKNTSRTRADELFPACSKFWKLKKHDGLAEAAILAHYISDDANLDGLVPGDISELYNIEGNKRVRAKNPGRNSAKPTSPKGNRTRNSTGLSERSSTGRSVTKRK